MIGHKVKDEIFQLMDHYTIFYFEFIKGKRRGKNYWQAMQGQSQHNTWCGLAFERVCLWHVDQIKMKLGISGVLTNEYAWQCRSDKETGRVGVQIDLLIDRSDGIIDLCEMKFTQGEFVIDKTYDEKLRNKLSALQFKTQNRKNIQPTLVTTFGLKMNMYSNRIQRIVTLDDLFKLF